MPMHLHNSRKIRKRVAIHAEMRVERTCHRPVRSTLPQHRVAAISTMQNSRDPDGNTAWASLSAINRPSADNAP